MPTKQIIKRAIKGSKKKSATDSVLGGKSKRFPTGPDGIIMRGDVTLSFIGQSPRSNRTGKGFHAANWKAGAAELAANGLPRRQKDIPRHLKDIQTAYTKAGGGRIRWGEMSARYRDVSVGWPPYRNFGRRADVAVYGRADGNDINYFYDNAARDMAVQRYAVFNGRRLRINDLGSNFGGQVTSSPKKRTKKTTAAKLTKRR